MSVRKLINICDKDKNILETLEVPEDYPIRLYSKDQNAKYVMAPKKKSNCILERGFSYEDRYIYCDSFNYRNGSIVLLDKNKEPEESNGEEYYEIENVTDIYSYNNEYPCRFCINYEDCSIARCEVFINYLKDYIDNENYFSSNLELALEVNKYVIAMYDKCYKSSLTQKQISLISNYINKICVPIDEIAYEKHKANLRTLLDKSISQFKQNGYLDLETIKAEINIMKPLLRTSYFFPCLSNMKDLISVKDLGVTKYSFNVEDKTDLIKIRKRDIEKLVGDYLCEIISILNSMIHSKFNLQEYELIEKLKQFREYIEWKSYIDLTIDAKNALSSLKQSCSTGELKVKLWLEKNGIYFLKEMPMSGLKDKANLRFDFYLVDNKTVIEVDGPQHHKPYNFFGGIDGFNTLRKHDRMKNEYCKKHNINLIRITYEQLDDLDNILQELV